MKINILASALVVALLLGPTSLVQGQTQRSSETNSDASSAAAKARKDAVNTVLADLRTAISKDPKNASKYTAVAVQILGIDTKTEAGRAELDRIQRAARNALRRTDSFKAMPLPERLAAIESITTESTNAVGTRPTMTSITVNPQPTDPRDFPGDETSPVGPRTGTGGPRNDNDGGDSTGGGDPSVRPGPRFNNPPPIIDSPPSGYQQPTT